MKGYPFRVTLIGREATPLLGQILKINSTGFLVQLEVPVGWQVAQQIQAQFVLPLLEKAYDVQVKIVKVYFGLTPGPSRAAKEKLQMLEMHFLGLAPHQKSAIDQFVAQSQIETGDKTGS